MAGTMLGEAVTFDPSWELRPTPNTSFFLSLNLKWQYTILKCFIPSYAEASVVKKISSKSIFTKAGLPFACLSACVHIRGVSDLRASSVEKTQSPRASTVLEGSFKRMQRLNTSVNPSSEDEHFSFTF